MKQSGRCGAPARMEAYRRYRIPVGASAVTARALEEEDEANKQPARLLVVSCSKSNTTNGTASTLFCLVISSHKRYNVESIATPRPRSASRVMLAAPPRPGVHLGWTAWRPGLRPPQPRRAVRVRPCRLARDARYAHYSLAGRRLSLPCRARTELAQWAIFSRARCWSAPNTKRTGPVLCRCARQMGCVGRLLGAVRLTRKRILARVLLHSHTIRRVT